MESVKSDCACALQRKAPENLPASFAGTLSLVRFEGKTRGIAAIFSDCCSNAARFLCSSDWVAERVGFEADFKRQLKDLLRHGQPSKTT